MKLLIPFIFVFANGVNAQNSLASWNGYFGNFSITDQLNFHNELQYRNNDFKGTFNQLLIRNGIGYNLTPDNNNLLLGYAFNLAQKRPSSNGKLNELLKKEHRIFQQFITKNTFERVFLLHRYRIEQRFFNSDFQLRFRYFMALYIPFNHKQITKNTWYLAAYNEIFINQKDEIFDQYRLSQALGYAITKNVKVELGVFTQFHADDRNLAIQLSVFNNLAFKHHYTKKHD